METVTREEDGAGPAVAAPPNQGPELLLPIIGTAFAVYYLFTIVDLPLEARIGGYMSAGGVIILSLAIVTRTVLRALRGQAVLSLAPLFLPVSLSVTRGILLVLLFGFVLQFETLGLTATVFLFLLFAQPLVGGRSIPQIVAIATITAAVAYFGFIVFLPTQFPEGLLESFLNGWFSNGH